MRDENREISPLEREEGYGGKDLLNARHMRLNVHLQRWTTSDVELRRIQVQLKHGDMI